MSQKVKRFFQRNQAAALTCCLILLTRLYASALEIPAPLTAPDSLRAHARYLASEQLTGRGVDTAGIKLARDYIAREFARYGFRPGGDNGTYLQGFDVPKGVTVKQPTTLALASDTPVTLERDWTPLGLS